MVRFILLSIAWLIGSFVQAHAADDKAWDREELNRRLTANLVLNGALQIPFKTDSQVYDTDIAPCWSISPRQPDQIKYDGEKITIDPSIASASFRARAIQYFFSENEPAYTAEVSGDFAPDSTVTVDATVCNLECSDQRTVLKRDGPTRFTGAMTAPAAGSYVQSFVLTVDKASAVRGLWVLREGARDDAELLQRDTQSLQMCVISQPHMQGEVKPLDVAVIAVANLLFLATMAGLLVARSYFPLFLVGAYYLTNVFGLPFLYFGMSNQRMIQGATDRAVIAQLAWFNIMILIVAFGAFYIVSRFARIFVRRGPLIGGDVDPTLVNALFVVISVVFVVTNLGHAVQLYTTLGVDSSYATYIRNNIVKETLGLKPHYFSLIFRHVPVLLSFFMAANFLKRRWYVAAVAVIAIQGAMLIYNGEKGPLAWYAYACVFLMFTAFNIKTRYVMMLCAAALVLAVVGFFGQFRIALLADRMFFGGLTVAHHILTVFPAERPFLNGESMRLFGFGPGAERFNLELLIWREIFPERVFSHLTGTAVGAFWTQVYANFGGPAAVVSGALMAAIAAVSYYACRTLFSPAVAVPLTAWLVFSYAAVGEVDITRYIADFYLVGIFLFTLVLLALSAAWRSMRRQAPASR